MYKWIFSYERFELAGISGPSHNFVFDFFFSSRYLNHVDSLRGSKFILKRKIFFIQLFESHSEKMNIKARTSRKAPISLHICLFWPDSLVLVKRILQESDSHFMLNSKDSVQIARTESSLLCSQAHHIAYLPVQEIITFSPAPCP